jgi:hypothetical protein
VAKGGQAGPTEVPALRSELGSLHLFGLLQALILGLRISDGFGQHLAQLSLGLRRFPGSRLVVAIGSWLVMWGCRREN